MSDIRHGRTLDLKRQWWYINFNFLFFNFIFISFFSDLCLSEPKRSGTKRKLTQQTLLQLNFTRPVNLTHPPDYTSEEQFKFTESHTVVNTHTPSHALDYKCQEQLEFTENHSVDVDLVDSAIVTTASSSSLSLNFNEIDTDQHDDIEKNDIVGDVDDKCDIFGVKFETLIVGRKYADKEEVCVGDTVSLLRDSQNVKDANAIKVFVYFCFF